MSFKEYFFKKIIPNYFMIVTLITIGMAVSGILVYGNRDIGMATLFVPPGFGALGSLPLLLDYAFLKVKSSGAGLLLYNGIELVLLEAVILTAAYFLDMIDSILSAGITAVMVFAIFTVVGAIMYIQDKKFCDDLNDALAKYAQSSRKS